MYRDRPRALAEARGSRCRGCTSRPTEAPNAFATGRNPQQRRGLLHRGHPGAARRARAARRPRPRARRTSTTATSSSSSVAGGAGQRRSCSLAQLRLLIFGGVATTTTAATRSALLLIALLGPIAAGDRSSWRSAASREYQADESGRPAHRRPAGAGLRPAQARAGHRRAAAAAASRSCRRPAR